MNYDEIALDYLQTLTRVNLADWISRYLFFNATQLPQLQAWLNAGDVQAPTPTTQLKALQLLVSESNEFLQDFGNNKTAFTNTAYWQLADFFQSARNNLQPIISLPKFMRVSQVLATYAPRSQREYTPFAGETLQSVSRNQEHKTNFLNEWVNIALKNQLREEDYSISSTPPLTIDASLTVSAPIQAVVDSSDKERVLGIDIDRKLTFVDDDLKVLDYYDTFNQAVVVLASMYQGDNPYLPGMGLPQSLNVGQPASLFQASVVARSIQQTFGYDDSIASVKLASFKISGTIATIGIEVQSVYGSRLETSVTV